MWLTRRHTAKKNLAAKSNRNQLHVLNPRRYFGEGKKKLENNKYLKELQRWQEYKGRENNLMKIIQNTITSNTTKHNAIKLRAICSFLIDRVIVLEGIATRYRTIAGVIGEKQMNEIYMQEIQRLAAIKKNQEIKFHRMRTNALREDQGITSFFANSPGASA